jgi:23S rRNA (guanosine2251-2'-O)-methyltransferase
MKKESYLLLHDIRSIHNVGALFRTADAAGISRIYLSGYTPGPIDRFGRTVKELSKVALGGEHFVDWEYITDPLKLIKSLKKEKTQIISIEQHKKAVDYKTVKVKYPVLFIVGNEVTGVSNGVLKMSDVIAEIRMSGKKESLNVGISFGIAVFRMLDI